jgi:hypothetical protein
MHLYASQFHCATMTLHLVCDTLWLLCRKGDPRQRRQLATFQHFVVGVGLPNHHTRYTTKLNASATHMTINHVVKKIPTFHIKIKILQCIMKTLLPLYAVDQAYFDAVANTEVIHFINKMKSYM